MPRGPVRTPSQIESDYSSASTSRISTDSQISTLKIEARSAIYKEFLDLLRTLRQNDVNTDRMKLRKKTRSGSWSFEISFSASDLASNPDVSAALAKIAEYQDAAQLDDKVVFEENV